MTISLGKKEIIHFVGIGGIGMSGLALIMKDLGFNIDSYKEEYNKNNIKNNLFFFEDNFLCKKNNFDIAITRAGA